MVKSGDRNRVVGKDFRVEGLKGLRIADMSVCPILTSNHTQIKTGRADLSYAIRIDSNLNI
jgi:choline dehydrogenase-like flavoprotein